MNSMLYSSSSFAQRQAWQGLLHLVFVTPMIQEMYGRGAEYPVDWLGMYEGASGSINWQCWSNNYSSDVFVLNAVQQNQIMEFMLELLQNSMINQRSIQQDREVLSKYMILLQSATPEVPQRAQCVIIIIIQSTLTFMLLLYPSPQLRAAASRALEYVSAASLSALFVALTAA